MKSTSLEKDHVSELESAKFGIGYAVQLLQQRLSKENVPNLRTSIGAFSLGFFEQVFAFSFTEIEIAFH